MVAVTDLRGLTVIAKTELIVDKVSANISSKQLTKLNNLHVVLKRLCIEDFYHCLLVNVKDR